MRSNGEQRGLVISGYPARRMSLDEGMENLPFARGQKIEFRCMSRPHGHIRRSDNGSGRHRPVHALHQRFQRFPFADDAQCSEPNASPTELAIVGTGDDEHSHSGPSHGDEGRDGPVEFLAEQQVEQNEVGVLSDYKCGQVRHVEQRSASVKTSALQGENDRFCKERMIVDDQHDRPGHGRGCWIDDGYTRRLEGR